MKPRFVSNTVFIVSLGFALTELPHYAIAEESPRSHVQCEELGRFDSPKESIAVAVDGKHIYAVEPRSITRCDKVTGEVEMVWHAPKRQNDVRLGAGVMHEGKLFCSHSNSPRQPTTNSVEVWNRSTMRHVASHSLGIDELTIVSIARHQDAWWALLVPPVLDHDSSPPARDNRWTTLVRFDDQWRRTGAWTLPAKLVEELGSDRCTGGTWNAAGRYFCTVGDRGDLYELALPVAGSALRWVKTYATPFTGGGVNWDPQFPNVLYGVDVKHRKIVAIKIPSIFTPVTLKDAGKTAQASADPATPVGAASSYRSSEVSPVSPQLRFERRHELRGQIAHPDEHSGVTLWRKLLVACPDEGDKFNVLRREGDVFEMLTTVELTTEDSGEIDMEGAAADADYVYVIGSHSMSRKKFDPEGTRERNRERQQIVAPHPNSCALYRIKLDDAGNLSEEDHISLKPLLEKSELLRPFLAIPGKENGIDIEGVAVRESRVYVGFRGPVLRGNFVPVMSLNFDDPDHCELKFVALGGRGIRDLVAVDDGILILGGPVGEGDASCQLYFWDEEDAIPGDDVTAGVTILLSEVPGEDGALPEGLTLLDESTEDWRVLVVMDGATDAAQFAVSKP